MGGRGCRVEAERADRGRVRAGARHLCGDLEVVVEPEGQRGKAASTEARSLERRSEVER